MRSIQLGVVFGDDGRGKNREEKSTEHGKRIMSALLFAERIATAVHLICCGRRNRARDTEMASQKSRPNKQLTRF